MKDPNHDRFTGFADVYDAYRPRPPVHTARIILTMIGKEYADLVVDLGSGTGLSSVMWQEYSEKIIGVEPNDDMRSHAERHNPGINIEYRAGDSACTGLDDSIADIVCCSQSFHWMEPVSTLAEVSRILKPGGAFAAIDNDWPPIVDWRSELEYCALFGAVSRITKKHSSDLPHEIKYPKEGHLDNISKSGYFDYCREIVFHNGEECDADRFINLALSQGGLQALIKAGIDDIRGEIDRFASKVHVYFGEKTRDMTVSYRMRVGIKKV